MSSLLVTREIQMKTRRYHFIVIKQKYLGWTASNAALGVRKSLFANTTGGNYSDIVILDSDLRILKIGLGRQIIT